MLPVSVTKAGPGDKEPAYVVLRRHAVKCLLLVAGVVLLVLLKFYDYTADIDRLRIHVKAFSQNLKLSEVSEVSSFTRVGEELERHLDRDLRELELGEHLMQKLKNSREKYLLNVTALVTTTLKEAADSNDSQGSRDAILGLQGVLVDQLSASANAFFDQTLAEIGGLVHHLALGAREAQNRREDLQAEIRKRLHRVPTDMAKGPGGGGDLDGDGWVEDPDRDGFAEEPRMTDDEWALETEKWHNDTVASFFSHLDSHLNASSHGPQRYTLEVSSGLYKEMQAALEHLYEGKAKWGGVQDLMHARAADMTAAGLPAYEDVEPAEDDEYDGYQIWHVQNYLEDALWPARLTSRVSDLEHLRRQWRAGQKTALEVVSAMEDLAAENAVPHHWLHHGPDDDMMRREWDDYF
uniref:Uncharacterized protein n=1 Tax=Rhizochromulina marina TaxID=1034831 RepID=A0A7S2RL46_9STRA|mmetsp:Transcript_17885/g.52239  ORF Transcript_17885/g.52239 Transcript_17885/m.52239 type:complete len:408 (+) Transcript_17885:77-1300(+)